MVFIYFLFCVFVSRNFKIKFFILLQFSNEVFSFFYLNVCFLFYSPSLLILENYFWFWPIHTDTHKYLLYINKSLNIQVLHVCLCVIESVCLSVCICIKNSYPFCFAYLEKSDEAKKGVLYLCPFLYCVHSFKLYTYV